MTFDARKKVALTENERLDLPDAQALSDLPEVDQQTRVRALIDEVGPPGPATSGRVFRGFSVTPGTGLQVIVDDVAGVAIDADGNVILRDTGTTVTVGLADNTTPNFNYVYVYQIDTPSDSDSRRLIDPTSGLEVTANVETRSTRAVGFYQSLLQISSAVIGGKVRQLVPICKVVTSGGAIVGSPIDTRPLLPTYVGDASTQAEIAALLPTSFTLRGWLSRIAQQISNVTGLKWWQTPTRTLEAINTDVFAAHTSVYGVYPALDTRLDDIDTKFLLQHNAAGGHMAISATTITADSISLGTTVVAGGNITSGAAVIAKKFLADQGVPGAPGGYSFFQDGAQDTGMFSQGDGDLALITNDIRRATVDAVGLTVLPGHRIRSPFFEVTDGGATSSFGGISVAQSATVLGNVTANGLNYGKFNSSNPFNNLGQISSNQQNNLMAWGLVEPTGGGLFWSYNVSSGNKGVNGPNCWYRFRFLLPIRFNPGGAFAIPITPGPGVNPAGTHGGGSLNAVFAPAAPGPGFMLSVSVLQNVGTERWVDYYVDSDSLGVWIVMSRNAYFSFVIYGAPFNIVT